MLNTLPALCIFSVCLLGYTTTTIFYRWDEFFLCWNAASRVVCRNYKFGLTRGMVLFSNCGKILSSFPFACYRLSHEADAVTLDKRVSHLLQKQAFFCQTHVYTCSLSDTNTKNALQSELHHMVCRLLLD